MDTTETVSDDTFTLHTIRDKRTGLYVGRDSDYTLGPFSECFTYRSKTFALQVGDRVREDLMREQGQVCDMELIEITCMNAGPAL